MLLVIRRDQRKSFTGKPIFQLGVRAEIHPDELSAINHYGLGATVLYSKGGELVGGSGLLGLASRLAFKAMNISVSVSDLTHGKKIECKDILEMLAVEDQIKEAATTFKAVLNAAMYFGGEEAIEI